MVVSPLVVLAAGSGLICAVAGWVVYHRWTKPGADWFAISAAGGAIWALGYAAGLLVFDSGARLAFEVPIWIGHGVAPVGFLLFVTAYTGRLDEVGRPTRLLLWVVPAITVALVATSPGHGLMWSGYAIEPTWGAATVLYEKGPWLYVHKLYSYVVLLLAAAMLLEMIVARDAVYTIQAALLGAAIVPLGAGSVVWVVGAGPYPQVTATPFLFGVVFAVAAVVLFRSSIADSAPAARRIGRARAFDDVADGVCILDDGGRIVDHNDAAVDLLAADGGTLMGRPIGDVLDGDPRLDADGQRIDLETASGRRIIEVRPSPVADGTGDGTLGHVLLLQDVTEATRRRQQLTVLNRVLRHNLRNDMTVVRAYAEELADDPDPERAAMAETIVEEADGLVSLGEGARTVEELLDGPDHDPEPIDLRALAEAVCEPYDDVAIELRIDSGLQVRTYESVLRSVLDAAVENAVEHGSGSRDSQTQPGAGDREATDDREATADRETTDGAAADGGPEDGVAAPDVELAAERDGEWTTITVSDRGPGIPEHELAPIESGTETALEHGSGLGLWVIAWGITSLGGEVSVEADDGTDVILRLPDRP